MNLQNKKELISEKEPILVSLSQYYNQNDIRSSEERKEVDEDVKENALEMMKSI